MKAVIFDLDLTLIDSRAALALRRQRQWTQVYRLIPELKPYPGVSDLLVELRAHQVPVSIVTSTPGSYCSRVITQWKWPITTTVCWHDTQAHKPHPEPVHLALRRLGLAPTMAMAVGDDPTDIACARAAGVYAVGAAWGSVDPAALVAATPDALCATVSELRTLLLSTLR